MPDLAPLTQYQGARTMKKKTTAKPMTKSAYERSPMDSDRGMREGSKADMKRDAAAMKTLARGGSSKKGK